MWGELPKKFSKHLKKNKKFMCSQLFVWPALATMARTSLEVNILYIIYLGIVVYFCIAIHGLIDE